MEKRNLNLYHTILLTTVRKKALENIVGKRENVGNQHVFAFLTITSALQKSIFFFFGGGGHNYLFCCLQMILIWTGSKFLSFGKHLQNVLTQSAQADLC